jgi:hypothetical protein
MKQYEPIAKLFSILGWFLFIVGILIILTPENGSAPLVVVMNALPHPGAFIGLIGLLSFVISGMWLGVLAKRSGLNVWIWSGLGLGLGVISVWVFYRIQNNLRELE